MISANYTATPMPTPAPTMTPSPAAFSQFAMSIKSQGLSSTTPICQARISFGRGHLDITSQHATVTVNGSTVPLYLDDVVFWQNQTTKALTNFVRTATVTFRPRGTFAANTVIKGMVNILSGTLSDAPLITPAALVAAKQVEFRHSGYDYGSDVFKVNATDIVTNFSQDTWGTNPLGGWRVRQSNPHAVMIEAWRYHKRADDGVSHRWNRDTIYLQYRADGKYTVAGRTEQPNWDVPHPSGTVGDIAHCLATVRACELWDVTAGSIVYAWGGSNDPRTVRLSASAFNTRTNKVSGMVSVSQGTAVALSGAGLPTGITANTVYFTNGNGQLFPCRSNPSAAPAAVTFGTAGNGSAVCSPLHATFYGCAPTLLDPNGDPLVIGGTINPVTLAWDEAYQSNIARTFPVYDRTQPRYGSDVIAAAYNPQPYYPGWAPYGKWLAVTGDNPGDFRIGPKDHLSVASILLPHDLGYRRQVARYSAGFMEAPVFFRDVSSGRVLVTDNGSDDGGTRYPGMGPNRPAIGWNYGDGSYLGSSGGGGSRDHHGYYDGYSNAPVDSSHHPNPHAAAAYNTGHPIFMDANLFLGVALGHLTGGTRGTQTYVGHTYYAIIGMEQQTRGSAWCWRTYGDAEMHTPSSFPEGFYCRNRLNSSAKALQAYALDAKTNYPDRYNLGLLNERFNAHWLESIPQSQCYMDGYFGIVTTQDLLRGERPELFDFAKMQGNLLIGLFDDSDANGGSGYLLGGGAGYMVRAAPSSGAALWPTIRSLIANGGDFRSATAPFPSTGFIGNRDDGGRPSSFYNNGGWVFGTTDYPQSYRAYLAQAAQLGLVSANGNVAATVYDSVMKRFNTAPSTGIKFSFDGSIGSLGAAGKNQFYVFAIQKG